MVNPWIGELKGQNENPQIAIAKKKQLWPLELDKKKRERLVLLRMTKTTKICHIAQETIFSILSETIMEQNEKKREFRYIHIYA